MYRKKYTLIGKQMPVRTRYNQLNTSALIHCFAIIHNVENYELKNFRIIHTNPF